jgi:hypothetical protein
MHCGGSRLNLSLAARRGLLLTQFPPPFADDLSVKTSNAFSSRFIIRSGLLLLLVVGLGLCGSATRAADEKFDVLRVCGQDLSNATVLTCTKTDLFIKHSGGLANFKLKDVEVETLKQLGFEVELPPTEKPKSGLLSPTPIAARISAEIEDNPQLQAIKQKWQAQVQSGLPPIPRGVLAGVLGLVLAGYLFYCYCCKLIVEKTGNEAGVLIWLPILQMFPLLRAAGMGGGWFFLWLVPVLNIIASLMWCFKIVEARGKSFVWAILLLLPGTNLLAFFYLAFSDGASAEQKSGRLPYAQAA